MNNSTSTIPSFDPRLIAFKRVVDGYLLSIVCICGLLGNMLTCVILSSRFMRNSTTNIYIFALSCASSFVLFGYLLTHGIRSTFRAEQFYQQIFTVVFPIHVTCLLTQIYLTATVAVDRFVLICLPFRGRRWRSPTRAIFVVLGVTSFCILYCVPFWFEYTTVKRNNTQVITVSKIGQHRIFRTLMRKYLYFVFVFLIPLSTILSCKIMIIRELYTVRKRKRVLRNAQKQSRSSNAINLLLLSIVFVFLVTQFPYFIFNVFYSFLGPEWMSKRYARQYLSINNLLSVINASSTFILYAFFDRKFREVGKHYLLCQPLKAEYQMYGGATTVSARHNSVFTPILRISRPSINILKINRNSSSANQNIQETATQELLQTPLTSGKDGSIPVEEKQFDL